MTSSVVLSLLLVGTAQPAEPSRTWMGPQSTALLGVNEVGVFPCVPEKEPPADDWRVGRCELKRLLQEALALYSFAASVEIREAPLPFDTPFFLFLEVRSLDVDAATSKTAVLVRLSLLKSGRVLTGEVPGVTIVTLWHRDRFELADRSKRRAAIRVAVSALLKEWVDDLVVARAVERRAGSNRPAQ